MRIPSFFWLLLSIATLNDGSHALGQPPSLFETLTRAGVDVVPNVHLQLPQPYLQSNLEVEAQQSILQEISTSQGYDRFIRNSVVSPVSIAITGVQDAGENRVGHLIRSAFVLFRTIEQLNQEQEGKELFQSFQAQGEGKCEVISSESLQEHGFASANPSEKTIYLELPLLEKVQIQCVVRIERTELPDGWRYAWHIDPSLQKMAPYRTGWRFLRSDSLEPDMHPYVGCLGYVQVLSLKGIPNAVLIESTTAMLESPEWFAASNQLRSKLPIAIQESVRSFRKKFPPLP